MSTTSLNEYLFTLAKYHAWQGRELLKAAARLQPEQLRSGSLSHGSVFDTLVHVLDVNGSWRSAAEEVPEPDFGKFTTLDDLRRTWLIEDERFTSFVAALTADDLDREVTPSWKDRPFRVWWIVSHIVHHQVDHANEIGWELTRLGASPRDTALMGYLDTHRGGV